VVNDMLAVTEPSRAERRGLDDFKVSECQILNHQEREQHAGRTWGEHQES
jgi:hypothetical protein